MASPSVEPNGDRDRGVFDRLLRPRSIAVIGAGPDQASVGGQVLKNIAFAGFEGPLLAVNPRHAEVHGCACFPDLDAVKTSIDLAVIATPAQTVSALLEACGRHGIRAAVVMSAARGSADERARWEHDVLDGARRADVRIVGPNCLGVVSPYGKINATFSKGRVLAGDLALISQSGALCTAIMDWAEPRRIGFSALLSLGDSIDVDLGEVLDHLALDEQTRSILLYVEGVRDARRFISGLRVASRLKPVVILKAGRHSESARASFSHTGALVGTTDAFNAAVDRAGAVRVETIGQLFSSAQALAAGIRLRDNRVTIVTNAGGPGVMAVDRTLDLGMRIAHPTAPTIETLRVLLPEAASLDNPIDVRGDASADAFSKAVGACLADGATDAVLAILTPQAITAPFETAQKMVTSFARSKPLFACWMGDTQVRDAWDLFARHGIPQFRTPENAVEALFTLDRFRKNQKLLLHVPGTASDPEKVDGVGARRIIETALAAGRTQLTISESKAVLNAFGISTLPGIEAHTADEACTAAETVGFPVVMKIVSPDVVHKSDVGGVVLEIRSAAEVRDRFAGMMGRARSDLRIEAVVVEPMHRPRHGREVIVGCHRDVVFGPVLVFGHGGIEVEVTRDTAVELPPLNAELARALIERTAMNRLLEAYRNVPAANREALVRLLIQVSEMVCELPEIVEMDLNPVVVDVDRAVCLDARMRVSRPAPARREYGHVAIAPYPSRLTTRWSTADGTRVIIRPIRPEDAAIEAAFVRNLSFESRYLRFMEVLRELTPEMLARFTQIDYDREMALIAVREVDGAEGAEPLGVARYVGRADMKSCEFGLVVADAWQHKGLGTELMKCLMRVARERGIQEMTGEVLTRNGPMLNLVRDLGFVTTLLDGDPTVIRVDRRLD